MRFSLEGTNAPGHLARMSRFSRGGSPIRGGGTFYGTKVRCECGVEWKTNEGPPSGEGGKDARAWYRDHVRSIITTEQYAQSIEINRETSK